MGTWSWRLFKFLEELDGTKSTRRCKGGLHSGDNGVKHRYRGENNGDSSLIDEAFSMSSQGSGSGGMKLPVEGSGAAKKSTSNDFSSGLCTVATKCVDPEEIGSCSLVKLSSCSMSDPCSDRGMLASTLNLSDAWGMGPPNSGLSWFGSKSTGAIDPGGEIGL